MKKCLALFLAAIMLIGIFGCGTDPNADSDDGGSQFDTFVVGYAEADVTPTAPLHLGSFQNAMERVSTGVRDTFYAKTLALTDTNGNTLLIIITDLSWGYTTQVENLRAQIKAKYNIAEENVLLGGTHNHNGPEWKGDGYATAANQAYFNNIWYPGVLSSVDAALADRASATLLIGSDYTEGLTFVRRFLQADGSLSESNDPIDRYESEGDEQAQFLKITREGKKDVLLTQWQCHANLFGNTTTAGTDWVGPMRDKMEEELDCYVMYMNGAAGNMNPNTKGKFLTEYPSVDSVDTKGEMVAEAFIEMVTRDGFFTEVETGEIKVKQVEYSASGIGITTWTGEMNSVVIGNLGLVTMPVEMFAESGVAIKEGSPCEMTLLMGYSNGICGYVPTREAVLNGGYEITSYRANEDTADEMVQIYLDGLKELYGG